MQTVINSRWERRGESTSAVVQTEASSTKHNPLDLLNSKEFARMISEILLLILHNVQFIANLSSILLEFLYHSVRISFKMNKWIIINYINKSYWVKDIMLQLKLLFKWFSIAKDDNSFSKPFPQMAPTKGILALMSEILFVNSYLARY